MHICVLQHVFDPFKGANHLPLYAAIPDCTFTIVCGQSKALQTDLPTNVKIEIVPGRMGSYYFGFRDWNFARNVLKSHPPKDSFWKTFDVLHCNQVMGPALKKLRATGLPFLLTIHHPVTADRDVAVQESNLLSSIIWRLKYALLVMWQKSMCHAVDRVVTVSKTVRDRLVADYSCKEPSISIVSNGVDGSIFVPTEDAIEFDVISMGSFIHPRKGFSYLLEAYRSLTAAGCRIADVGRRSQEQAQLLQNIPGVTVHGTIDGDRLIHLLQRSQVLISTSLYEGFGLSLIEALSCGRPAFAFDGGAVSEVLSSIDPDLVVPSHNTNELVTRVQNFLHLPELQKEEKGTQYRKAVLKQYSLQSSAKALQELYKHL